MSKRVSKVSIDHDEIRRWAEARGGEPAVVRGTGRRGTGIIRLDFPGYTGQDKLEHVSWDEWFTKFDDSNLALVFEETTARGQKSNFNKLIGRETVDVGSGEVVAPPRRRAKEGARTQQEARKLRSRRVSAGRSRAAAARAGAGKRATETPDRPKKPTARAARGARGRGTEPSRTTKAAQPSARGRGVRASSGGGSRRRAPRA